MPEPNLKQDTMPSTPLRETDSVSIEAALDAGRAAWARLQECERRSWSDWIEVARALVVGRTVALLTAGTNQPVGTRYNLAMGDWLRSNGLHGISPQERYRALLVLENLPAISAWRDGLDEAQRRRLNHPSSVWARWRRATNVAPHVQHVARRGTPTPMAKGYGRPIYWPADALRRAATAIREARSADTYILARRALEAAIRNESDLLTLLEPPAKQRSYAA